MNSKVVYIASSLPNSLTLITKDQVRGIQIALDNAGYMAGKYKVGWLPMNDSNENGWLAQLEEDNAKKVTENNSIVAYYGPYNSGAAKISMPILNKAGLLQFTVSTWPGLTKSGFSIGEPSKFYPTGRHHLFRLVPNDSIQGKVAVKFLKEKNIKNFSVIHDGRVYGKGISLIVKNEAEGLGMNVNYMGVVPGDDVVDDVVNKIIKDEPEAIFIGSDVLPGITKTYVKLRQDGYKGIILGSELSETRLINVVIPDDYNLYTVVPGVPVKNMKSVMAINFHDEYVKKYNEEPSQFSLFANQSINLILKAIAKSDGTRSSVRQQIENLNDIETAYGYARFDNDGDTLNNESSILHMNRGKWDFVESIKITN